MKKNKKIALEKLVRIFKQPSTYSSICGLLIATKFLGFDESMVTEITNFGIVVSGILGVWLDESPSA